MIMKAREHIISFLVLLNLVLVVRSSPSNSFIVIASKDLHEGTNAYIQATILPSKGSVGPVLVRAALISPNYSVLVSVTKSIAFGQTEILQFQVPDNLPFVSPKELFLSGYKLHVNGTQGLIFNNSTNVIIKKKSLTIYVQTDKRVYKPGQKVRMRVFGVYPDLKVYKEKMTVEIKDPNSYTINKWTDVQPESGVFVEELQLSSQPVKGVWSITVTMTQGSHTQQFQVKEYVLPRFEVTIDLPGYLVKEDKVVKGTVNARYTYGKKVKGQAVVTLTMKYFSQFKISKMLPQVDGTQEFSFSFSEIEKLFYTNSYRLTHLFYGYYELETEVIFIDDLTKQEAKSFNSVPLKSSRIQLQFEEINSVSFKPGLNFTAFISANQPDGSPLAKELESMQVNVDFNYRMNNGKAISYSKVATCSDGLIIVETVPPTNTSDMTVEVSYLDSTKEKVASTSRYFSVFTSPTNSFLFLSTTPKLIKAGDIIKLTAHSTVDIPFLNYMVMSRGEIFLLNSIYPLNSGQKTLEISVEATVDLVPSVKVIAYFVSNQGEVVADYINIAIDAEFKNKVSVEFSKKQVKPGQKVNLTVEASPDSHVSILAVDKSVILNDKTNSLGYADNDVSYEKVLSKLLSLDMSMSSSQRSHRLGPWCGTPFPSSQRSVMNIFMHSRLNVMTDCSVPSLNSWPYWIADDSISLLEAADARSKSGTSEETVTKIRNDFPETWLWLDAVTDSEGKLKITSDVPDVITSWVTSAFAISEDDGLAVIPVKQNLTVFQPFFVSMNLPYSIIRGEQVAIQAIVYNYLEKAAKVKVTLVGSEHWKGYNKGNVGSKESGTSESVYIDVPAGDGVSVSFPIIPFSLGQIPFTVMAESFAHSDAVTRNLLVEAEGIEKEYNLNKVIYLVKDSQVSETLELALPPDVISGSEWASVSVIGDIMGSSLNNFDHLIRMPYGCGEQNMINFVPNIYVLRYLTQVQQLTKEIEDKAKRYMTQGYQRELTYMHNDGSISAFGESDPSGSMWLTAFVLKSFSQAQAYIYIDNRFMDRMALWIATKQNDDGSFPEPGSIHSKSLQGGLNGDLSMTAYVLIALKESKLETKKVVIAINKAKRFLEIESTKRRVIETYNLAIMSYALKLTGSVQAAQLLQRLQTNAIQKDGLMYWSDDRGDIADSAGYGMFYVPKASADIEMTSYALLCYALNKDTDGGISIIRWLTKQTNSLGGYRSTQDTVMALQALSEFAPLVYDPTVNFNVEIISDRSINRKFYVSAKNSTILQKELISKVEGELQIIAKGKGIGIVQVAVHYNIKETDKKDKFDFDVTILEDSSTQVKTRSCATWNNEGSSGMAVMEIGLPSGFDIEEDQFSKLIEENVKLKRVEAPGRKVVLYFDEISGETPTCVELIAGRTYATGKAQPVPVVVYDYYAPENKATVSYLVQESADVCDTCEDCITCPKKSKNSSPGLHMGIFTIMGVVLIHVQILQYLLV